MSGYEHFFKLKNSSWLSNMFKDRKCQLVGISEGPIKKQNKLKEGALAMTCFCILTIKSQQFMIEAFFPVLIFS